MRKRMKTDILTEGIESSPPPAMNEDPAHRFQEAHDLHKIMTEIRSEQRSTVFLGDEQPIQMHDAPC